ncbi:MAG: rane protein [Massilia sp.]|nr:rane protein [Massilia sp.]
MTLKTVAELAAFVVRCVAAVLLAYLLASAVRLPHPLWACIFALITSQDSVSAPFVKTVGGRLIGTIIGVIVGVAVGVAASRIGLATVLQLAIAVLICALFAWRRPAVQLCLWTAPIVLLSATPAESIITVGFDRGCEVLIGVLVGGLIHVAAQKLDARTDGRGGPR